MSLQANRIDPALRPLWHENPPDFPFCRHVRVVWQPCILRCVLGNVDDSWVETQRLIDYRERSWQAGKVGVGL
jgi:hypothetical protein